MPTNRVPSSRLTRLEEKKAKKRIFIAFVGSAAVLVFLAAFGLPLFINFSLLVDRIRGGSGTTEVSEYILPPLLDPIPTATSSGTFDLSGRGQPNHTLIIYLNDRELEQLKIQENGTFTVTGLELPEGENIISAKQIDPEGRTSDLSNILTTLVKNTPPKIEISNPPDGSELTGEDNTQIIEGETEPNSRLTINDRFVLVGDDGKFSHELKLDEGENTIKAVVTDSIGNTTEKEIYVTYHK